MKEMEGTGGKGKLCGNFLPFFPFPQIFLFQTQQLKDNSESFLAMKLKASDTWNSDGTKRASYLVILFWLALA